MSYATPSRSHWPDRALECPIEGITEIPAKKQCQLGCYLLGIESIGAMLPYEEFKHLGTKRRKEWPHLPSSSMTHGGGLCFLSLLLLSPQSERSCSPKEVHSAKGHSFL